MNMTTSVSSSQIKGVVISENLHVPASTLVPSLVKSRVCFHLAFSEVFSTGGVETILILGCWHLNWVVKRNVYPGTGRIR